MPTDRVINFTKKRVNLKQVGLKLILISVH